MNICFKNRKSSGNHLNTAGPTQFLFSLKLCFHRRTHQFSFIETIIMKYIAVLLPVCCLFGLGLTATPTLKEAMDAEWNKLKALVPSMDTLKLNPIVNQTTCSCGVFLSGQFKKGSSDPPVGVPTLMHEQDTTVPCTPIGQKQCSNKCLETVSVFLHLFWYFSNKSA